MSGYTIRMLHPDAEFRVAPGQSVLEAAEAAGIAMQSSCRNGTCRTCMRRLVAGDLEYRVDWPGLSMTERAQGWVLPCVGVPRSELVLGEPACEPWWEG